MKIKLNTALLIAGYREPLPVGAVVVPQDDAEAGQLAALGYVTEVTDETEVTHEPHAKGETKVTGVVDADADADADGGKQKSKQKSKQ